jgi:hypothetical protein
MEFSSLGAKRNHRAHAGPGLQRLAAKGFNDLFEKTQPHGITVDCGRGVATDP